MHLGGNRVAVYVEILQFSMIIDTEWRPHNFTELLISIILTCKRTLAAKQRYSIGRNIAFFYDN